MASALEQPPPQPTSWIPNRKPTAGIIAAAVTAGAVWAAKAFGGVDMPADVAAGLTGVVSFVVSYLIPEGA